MILAFGVNLLMSMGTVTSGSFLFLFLGMMSHCGKFHKYELVPSPVEKVSKSKVSCKKFRPLTLRGMFRL